MKTDRAEEEARLEETLRKEKDLAQKYLDVAGVMFVAIDAHQKVTLINHRGSEIIGYKKEEIIGKNWFDTFLPERVREEVRAGFARLMSGDIEPIEYVKNPVLTYNGEERIISWHNTVMKDEAGNITGTLSSGEDVTEQKHAEEALRNERHRFESLTENTPLGMMLIARDGTTRYINPKFTELFGYDLTDIPDGKTWFKKAYPDQEYRRNVASTWVEHYKGSKPGEKEPRTFIVTCKDGRQKVVHFIPVALETGEFLTTCEDVTELKRAEEA
ncbi:MAG: hypothetical protein C0392_15190, partial [Syntrophus sp. (in: bacteria)]|nr:hypothetical protein [Syntrophus sp. (in: bacteria)]